MDGPTIKEMVWDLLRENVQPCQQHGRDELSVRCPFCGDSYKNKNSTHMYIKIDVSNETEPMMFNCFRCDTHGVLTPQILRMLEVSNLEINSSLTRFNKKAVKGVRQALGIKDNNLDFKIPRCDETNPRNIQKRDYICNRLQQDISFEELYRLKTIFSVYDFLNANNIKEISVHKSKLRMLNDDYVGFLTTRNEFINFRQVTPNKYGKRYEKYTVVTSIENTRKFYTIPTRVDLLSSKPIEINIAEGVFTLLGVYYNVKQQNMENQIYVAASGSGLTSVIKYFIRQGIIGNVIVNVYADRDKFPEYIAKQMKDIWDWVDTIHLYYNNFYDASTKQYENDFGVPADRIQLIEKKIPRR